MRVLVPATREPEWRGGEVVRLEPGDDGYWRFWRDVWAARETVIIVEHDITPSVQALSDLWECPNGWCSQPYPYLWTDAYHGLGCVKFGGLLMRATPDLWQTVAEMYDGTHPPKHWCRLDAWQRDVLQQEGWQRCEHQIMVEHPSKTRPSHLCM